MYLKSIEVQGFKSFANKMKFQFHNGITGIVGPNGSGKSNVADAVRWVLGEQSVKQLRGSNMQDVIFSGTENRKPLGFAMVSITLDNADHQLPVEYREVTVTRRLYRSGESEYLINGTACRLRDVREMFYDTGIGKEGYSIIGQGQIDRILSGKPEERRELFDEAAGIVKFKRRKLSAKKKLEEEESNLIRINDILSELTRQLGPLEQQAEKAKIFLKKKEDLKNWDIAMFQQERERISIQLREAEEKLSISDQDLAEVNEKLQQIRAEYERNQQEIECLDARLEERKSTLNEGMLLRQRLENQIALLQEQIRSAASSDEHFTSRMAELGETAARIQRELEQQGLESERLRETLQQAQNLEKEKTAAVSAAASETVHLEEQIAQGQAQLIEELNGRSNAKARMQRYDAMTEQIQIRRAQVTAQLLAANSEQSRREELEAEWRTQLEEVQQRINRIVEENQATEQEINSLQQRLVTDSRQLEETKTAYHQESTRLESVRNMTERYDGYGSSIRKVMEQKGSHPGLYGVVADLIRTEKKYETAIETALGGSIQNIVTDNEDTARQMIAFLKENRFGRATFLPLSAIRRKGGLSRENALYEPGALGVASTLVDTDDRYDELVEYLLGKTLVVDEIDHAIAISKKYRQSLRIVTLEGELFSPGGSMSGGAYRNSSNLLGRRREMEDLKLETARLKEQLEALQFGLEHIREERAALREKLVKKTEMLQQEYLNSNTLNLKLQELQTQGEKTLDDRRHLQEETDEMEKQLREIEEKQGVISDELAQAQRREESLEGQIRGWQMQLEEKKAVQEQSLKEQNEVHLQTAALQQKAEYQRETGERLTEELQRTEDEQAQLKESLSHTRLDTREKEMQIGEIRTTIARSGEEEQLLREEIEGLTGQRSGKNESQKEYFRIQEELSGQQNGLEKERLRLDNQKERLSETLDRQINYLWEEYEMTPSEAENIHPEGNQSPAQIKRLVSQLRGEIRALGSVNVNAIEDYREISERHGFLSAQHEDLVKTGEALKKVIAELDEGMRRQFREQFAIMQREFESSFRELFGGGKGTLELVEDEDILEAGIRIIAQPPGKKLQNMMQMSGGEKALTAIALLFAIQNMKPSPFCLLDEIEAALDENNVSRYANYLRKLTKNTQFIIITHRRGTMAAADRLYGITMQEKGISTQVSVNMVEEELDQ